MRFATLQLTLLFLLIPLHIIYCRTNSKINTCPSELPDGHPYRQIGYRLDDESCLTYLKIDVTEWSESMDYNETFNRICNLVNGKPYPLFRKSDLEKATFNENITLIALHGFFTTNVTEEYGRRCGLLWCYRHLWDVYAFFESNSSFLTHRQLHTDIYVVRATMKHLMVDKNKEMTDPEMYDIAAIYRNITAWRAKFNRVYSEHNPLLYIHTITEGILEFIPPVLASNISKLAYLPEYMACKHLAQKNCVYTILDACSMQSNYNNFLSKIAYVTQKPDPLYGTPCPTNDITNSKDITENCTEMCMGRWSRFTKERQPPCGDIIVERFSPIEDDVPPCNYPSPTCCVHQMIRHKPQNCSDFARNTTFNLKIEGCLRGFKPVMSSMGHLECPCPPRYTGIQCEVDLCEERCVNFTDCLLLTPNKAICICKLGFRGPTCAEKPEICGFNETCYSGECVQATADTGAYCRCDAGYAGESCELKAMGCTLRTCNRNGICYPDSVRKHFKCHCNANFTGLRCEISLFRKPENVSIVPKKDVSSSVGIYVGTTLFFIFLMIPLALIYRVRKTGYRRYRYHGRPKKKKPKKKGPERSLSANTPSHTDKKCSSKANKK